MKKNKERNSPWDEAWTAASAHIIIMFIVHGAASALTEHQRERVFKIGLKQNFDDDALWNIFVENFVNIKAIYPSNQSCLHLAVEHKNLVVVEALLKTKIDVDAVDSSHHTALHLAVLADDLGAVLYLLDAKPNRSIKTSNGNTALHYAILAKDKGLVTSLLRDEDLSKKYVIDELLYVCKNSLTMMLHVLLEIEVSPSAIVNTNEETPLHVVTAQPTVSLKVLQMLHENGADKYAVRKDGASILHTAVEGGIQDTIAEVLRWKLDPKAVTAQKHTALHTLVQSKSQHEQNGVSSETRQWIATQMIENKVPIHALDSDGKSALFKALETKDQDTIDILLQQCTEDQVLDDSNSKLIHTLVLFNPDILEEQITNGKITDIEAKTADDETPLLLAATQHKTESFQVLLMHKADIHARNNNGCTVLHLLLQAPAEVEIEPALAKLVKEDIKNILEVQGPCGKTPIQQAFQADRETCLGHLKKAGAIVPDIWTFDFSNLIKAQDVERIKKKLNTWTIDLAACEPGMYKHTIACIIAGFFR